MKSNSLKGNNMLVWVVFVLLLALIPSFYLHHRINGFIVMLIIIVGFIQYLIRPLSPFKMGSIMLMPLLFLVLVLGQLYSENIGTGWTLIERSLSVLLLPFASYGFTKFSNSQQKYLINTIILSGLLASLYCIGVQVQYALEHGTIYMSEHSKHFSYNIFMHHRLTEPLGLHAIYVSCFIALINIYLYHSLFLKNQKRSRSVLSIGLLLFFTMMIFLLKSAIISFGFSLAIILITLCQLKDIKNKRSRVGLVALLILVLVYAFLAVKSKMEFINLDYQMADEHMGMLAIRLAIWENALTVIQSNWLLGVGTGDADLLLLEQYRASGFKIGSEYDYNCHNMYLQYWLGNGVLGVGIFVAYFVMLFKRAIAHKNLIFIGFLIVFALFSFTESTMRVQKGMVFFMVFSSLFYWKPTLWKNSRI